MHPIHPHSKVPRPPRSLLGLERLRRLLAYPGRRVLEQPRVLGVMGVDVVVDVVEVMVGDAVDPGLEVVDVVLVVVVVLVLLAGEEVVLVVVVLVLAEEVEEVDVVLVVVVLVLVLAEEVEEVEVVVVVVVAVVVVVVVDDGGDDDDAFSPLHLPPLLPDRLGGLAGNLVPCVKPIYNDVYGCYYKIKNNWPKDGKLLM